MDRRWFRSRCALFFASDRGSIDGTDPRIAVTALVSSTVPSEDSSAERRGDMASIQMEVFPRNTTRSVGMCSRAHTGSGTGCSEN